MGRINNKRPYKSRKEQDEARGNGSDNDDENNDSGSVHKGSFPLDEIKASQDFSRRVEYDNPPKRKYAINFGYLGSQYQGLQINPGAITIEAILERALFLGGGIAESNYGNLGKLQWTRTARTDRGVHAVSQCCAMKLLMPLDQREAFINNINSFLPDDIRIHSVSKVTKNFHGKILCSKRRYHYLLPTYVLQDGRHVFDLLKKAFEAQGHVVDAGRAGGFADPGSDRFLGPEALLSIRNQLKAYRIDAAQLELLKSALNTYVGTKPYHNFTTGKAPTDANAKRYIVSFDCGAPFTDEATGTEFILLSVVGQSFLLNQIRKMVALVVSVCNGFASLATMNNALSGNVKMEIPMVPGLGLYLDELYFEAYNKKQEAEAQKLAGVNAKKAAEKETASPSVTATAAPAAAATATATATAAATDGDAEPLLKKQATSASDGAPVPAGAATVPAAAAVTAAVTVAGSLEDDENAGPSLGEKIDWSEDPPVRAKMDAFRSAAIWPHIIHEDAHSLTFMYYMDYTRVFPYHYTAKEYTDKKGGKGGAGAGAGVDLAIYGGASAGANTNPDRGAPRGLPPKAATATSTTRTGGPPQVKTKPKPAAVACEGPGS